MMYALKNTGAKFLMTMASSMNVAAATAKNAGISKERVLLLEGKLDSFTTLKELLEEGKSYSSGGQIPSFKFPMARRTKMSAVF